MSHFTRVKTKMVDQTALEDALRDLGIALRHDTVVRGWMGNKTKADLVFDSGSQGYDIGFVRQGDAFAMVADWYGIKRMQPRKLLNEVTARYAYRTTLTQLTAQGFSAVEESVDDRGTVRLLLRRMG